MIYYTVLKCDVHYLEGNHYELTIHKYYKIGMCSIVTMAKLVLQDNVSLHINLSQCQFIIATSFDLHTIGPTNF